MRIAHVTATFPPYYSGTGLVCYSNALELARRGHAVTVFTAAHPPGEYPYPKEITVRRLPIRFRLGNAPMLRGLTAIKGFDIIHLHHPFIFGAEMVWMISKMRSIPYVVTHHNDLIGNGLRRFIFDLYSGFSVPVVFGAARKFAVVSLDHAALCRLAPLFRKREGDVIEVPNGVDTSLFRPGEDGKSIRRQFGIFEEAQVVLFVGALDRAHYFKGVDYLLRAMACLGRPKVVLMIIGEGDLKRPLMALAEELGLAGQTRFLGAIANEKLPQYYAASEMVVLPSFPPESFGMVLIEAMACGKPVIASRLPGVRSVVSDGENGLLVKPGDVADLAAKIQMLLDHPNDREEMARHGRSKVETKYSWSAVVTQLEKVYHEALMASRGGSA